MVQKPWLRRFAARVWSSTKWNDDYFLNEDAFRFEFARELVRAERNGAPLALLLFELPVDNANRRGISFLAHVLQDRLRITDTAGAVGPRLLGVLLPETSAMGAWKVAGDVCDYYGVGHERPNCDVLMYPEITAPPVIGGSECGNQPTRLTRSGTTRTSDFAAAAGGLRGSY